MFIMLKRIFVIFLSSLLLIVSAVNTFATEEAPVQDIRSYSLYEAKEILDNYLFDNGINLDNDAEYYNFCVEQLLEVKDKSLSDHPYYALIEEFMVQYKLSYEDYMFCCDLKEIGTPDAILSLREITEDNDCIKYKNNEVIFSLSDTFFSKTIQDIIDEVAHNNAIKSVSTSASYNYSATAAKNYATTYATIANRAVYPVYSSDCTNFVSQCLKAGGIPMVGTNSTTGVYSSTSKWYCKCTYDSGANAANARQYAVTTSWIRVSDFNTYMTSVAKAKSTKTSQSALYNSCRTGDVVQLVSNTSGSPYHTVIITKRDTSEGMAYYSAHSSSKRNEPISTIFKKTNKVILFDFT